MFLNLKSLFSVEVMPALNSGEPLDLSARNEAMLVDSDKPPATSSRDEVIPVDYIKTPVPLIKDKTMPVDSNEPPTPSTSAEVLDSNEGTASSSRKRASQRVHLYSQEVLNMWNLERVFAELGTNEQCIAFSEARGLILTSRNCSTHRCPMLLLRNKGGPVGTFSCRKRNCRHISVSRAKKTWFENIRLPLPTVFRIMYCFSQDFDYYQTKLECSSSARNLALSDNTICDWFSCCRETVVIYQLENQLQQPKIGGPGKVVQVGQSKFGKTQFNKGKSMEGYWVLGMVDDETNDLRLEVCPCNERSAEVLIPLIKKHVVEGSIIQTDSLPAYDSLPTHGYIHRMVNHNGHKNQFIAEDGTNTQHIKSQWRNLQLRFQMDNNQKKHNFEDWLIEYTWRIYIRRNHKDPFESLIDAIKYVYKIYSFLLFAYF